jgi:hypothetical protein
MLCSSQCLLALLSVLITLSLGVHRSPSQGASATTWSRDVSLGQIDTQSDSEPDDRVLNSTVTDASFGTPWDVEVTNVGFYLWFIADLAFAALLFFNVLRCTQYRLCIDT